MDDHVTYLFGLPGFDILGIDDQESGGELRIDIERRRRHEVCRRCAARVVVKDRRWVTVRDLPAGGRPVVLRWRKRVFACRNIACRVKTFTETSPWIAPRAVLTARARRWAFEQVGRQDRTVSAVAADLSVSWGTIMTIVEQLGYPVIDDPARLAEVSAIGVDETSFLKAHPRHPTLFATGIVDITPGAPPRLLDVAAGKSGRVLADWLERRTDAWRDGIATAALDPFRGYATALETRLPNAVRVLDPFHAVRLAVNCTDEVRRRVQQDTLGRRGRTGDPLYAIRRVLRKRYDRLTDRQHQRLESALAAGDPNSEIHLAWTVGQQFMAAYHHRDPNEGRRLVAGAVAAASCCPVPEVRRLGRTLTRWMPELLAHFDHPGISNGPTENTNLKIKNTKRAGRGFRNFDNYRLRLLLAHGTSWHTQQPTRIRTRRPTMIA